MPKSMPAGQNASDPEQIDALIAGIDDWRGPLLGRLRELIKEAAPDVVESWKYMGSPVWESDGTFAVGNAHKEKVKLTFSDGASLPDPAGLFNNGNGKSWRAIDLHEGDFVDEGAFCELVRAAVEYRHEVKAAKAQSKAKPAKKTESEPAKSARSATPKPTDA
ncbi:DUF1801 domain-containing protein [Dietzia sp.]|uniref:DUF1801 domain-containing protein n=1 Tax=Dietzia sp. TaxID=1871616 RepID=UPI002FDACE4C